MYDYWFGLLSSLSMSFGGWVFATMFGLIAISTITWLAHVKYQKGHFSAIGLSVFSLIFMGVVGFIVVLLVYFIAYAFISEFRKDYQ